MVMRSGKDIAFEEIYNNYFDSLYYYALGFSDNKEEAKDLVHDVFLYYYRNSENIRTNTKSYLFKAIKNAGLNLISHKEVKRKYALKITDEYKELGLSEIENIDGKIVSIKKTLGLLPDKTRKVFLLSVVEGLKYREISEEMRITEHTVKFHITKALKLLREKIDISPENYFLILLIVKDL